MPRTTRQTAFLCSHLVMVRTDLDPSRLVVAIIEEISPKGACLRLETDISEGLGVEILCPGCSLRGKVRNCHAESTDYEVVVSLACGERWSRRWFTPDHLLGISPKGEIRRFAAKGQKGQRANSMKAQSPPIRKHLTASATG
jgi:hypothetical protein